MTESKCLTTERNALPVNETSAAGSASAGGILALPAHCRRDLSHMARIELAKLFGRGLKSVERQVSQLEARKDIIAPGARDGSGGKPTQGFAAPSTFGL